MMYERLSNQLAAIQVAEERHFIAEQTVKESTDNNYNLIDGELDNELLEESTSCIEDELNAIKKSIHSNLYFLFGSLLSAILSMIDIIWYYERLVSEGQNDQGDDGYYYYNLYQTVGHSIGLYSKFCVLAAGLFCLNAYQDWNIAVNNPSSKRIISASFNQSYNTDALGALCFGVGAAIDLFNALPAFFKMGIFSIKRDSTLEIVNASVGVVSSHFYFLSALFAFGKMDSTCYDKSTTSYFLGDLLFITGSTIDLVTSYISDPMIIEANKAILLKLWLMSNVLWSTNASLYLIGDYLWWRAEFVEDNDDTSSMIDEHNEELLGSDL